MPLKRQSYRPNVHVGPKLRSIPSQELCEKLARAMPYVPLGSQNFARSLVQNHETYGGWTPKQLDHAELLLERAREEYRAAQHAKRQDAEPGAYEEEQEAHPRVSDEGMRGLKRLFDAAKAAELKKPALLVRVGKAFGLKLVPAREGPDFVMFNRDVEGPPGFVGGLKATGALDVRRQYAEHVSAIAIALDDLGSNPEQAAKRYGRETGVCCFCARELTDKRSVKVGYGPICAAKWNLPWGA